MILPQQMTQKELAEQWKQGVQIMYRNQTKEVRIGDVVIGGDHPIAIQSMTNTRTEDVEATVEQILRLEKAGCEIIRCTVPTMEAAKAIKEIKKQIHIPLVADIHFDYKMAIAEKMVETVYLLLRERHLIWRMYRHIPVSRMWQSMEMCRILPMRT